MSSSLEAAARALTSAHAAALGSVESAKADTLSRRQAAERSAQSAYQKLLTVARNRAAQQVAEHSIAARNLGENLNSAGPSALRAAEYVTLGRLSMPGQSAGVNEVLSAPCVLPLIGRSNLIIEAERGAAAEITRTIVLEALKNTAPAELDVEVFDPLLTGALSPFAPMNAPSGGLFEIMSSSTDLERALGRLTESVHGINNTMRGMHPTLLDFREHTGRPIERLRLVVLLDYPQDIDEERHRKIMALAAAGPAAGISFLILTEGKKQPEWMARDNLRSVGEVIVRENGRLRWLRHPAFELTMQENNSSTLAQEVDHLARSAANASAITVPFTAIQPIRGEWHHSSADGITFNVGISGSETVEITFGDEKDQRHNALVTGAVGQGKSNLLKVIIHSLCERYAPTELELYLLDFKEGVTLYPLAPTPGSPDFLPHARVLGLQSDREFGVAVLRHLVQELTRRAGIFKPFGDNIAKYRAAVPDALMPRIVVIIDEFHVMFEDNDAVASEAAVLLQKLAKLGRAYGVHTILSSQSISGIAALMTTGDGIYAQFPIRLALKNSSAESQATMVLGNDAASMLRGRGQAVLNLDYGAVRANKQIVIAAADDAELNQIRAGWWERTRGCVPEPIVFDGSVEIRPGAALDSTLTLRRLVTEKAAVPSAVLGYPIDVTSTPLNIPLGDEPGRHLAIVGGGQKASTPEAGDIPSNVAVGTLQTAALSLALQHPAGDADFWSFDLLDPVTAEHNGQERWYSTMERLGFPVRRIGRESIADELKTLSAELVDGEVSGRRRYLMAFAFDRAVGLETPDSFSRRPVEDLQTILRDGPAQSTHFLGWWSSGATYKSHIGFGGDGYFDALLLLRMDQAAAQGLLGPFVRWSVRDNRGLLMDRAHLAEPTVVVPFAPLTPGDSKAFLTMDWNA
ncbi:hypothetical protein LFT45_17095 [Arthrobacter sp. FW305-BF8]|uniref:FtsK/SpoIIIE domain-containing protein n=1 Tax=Arthrobacter sp. FW305-BF8 TaxID=2879617 RepID=UPI001F24E0B6|nr:FtsK/SpoIIIE domain-containing protein [Arthrobacter sp. FW305-BF8]UKA53422.1 hypothetical protein LFT45_17095 [Arthrobacter sp. FW305-BF8]